MYYRKRTRVKTEAVQLTLVFLVNVVYHNVTLMRMYRLVLLLKSGLKKEKREKLLKTLNTWIGDMKDEKVYELGEKKLAYSIKKERLAEYYVVEFTSEGNVKDLDKRMSLQEDILRHLIVRMG